MSTTRTCTLGQRGPGPPGPSESAHDVEGPQCSRCQSLEEALDRAQLDSQCAEDAKISFLSALRHEIMTPLNCIQGAAQLLRMREEKSLLPIDKENSSLISIIEDSGQLLSSVLGDILNYSCMSQRDISLDLRQVNVRDLLENCVEEVRKNVEAKDLITTIQLTKELSVLIDPERTKQVLVNLLKNACKFNR